MYRANGPKYTVPVKWKYQSIIYSRKRKRKLNNLKGTVGRVIIQEGEGSIVRSSDKVNEAQ